MNEPVQTPREDLIQEAAAAVDEALFLRTNWLRIRHQERIAHQLMTDAASRARTLAEEVREHEGVAA